MCGARWLLDLLGGGGEEESLYELLKSLTTMSTIMGKIWIKIKTDTLVGMVQ